MMVLIRYIHHHLHGNIITRSSTDSGFQRLVIARDTTYNIIGGGYVQRGRKVTLYGPPANFWTLPYVVSVTYTFPSDPTAKPNGFLNCPEFPPSDPHLPR